MRNFARFSTALVFIASPVFSLVSHAVSTESADLEVSASVSANCTISTSALEFGAYDPVDVNAATALVGDGVVTVRCTQGASVVVELDDGAHPGVGSELDAPLRRLANGTNYLDYALYSDEPGGAEWATGANVDVPHTGTGNFANLTVYGLIPGGQNRPAGVYSDTVIASVTF